jgi:D-apionolactonase
MAQAGSKSRLQIFGTTEKPVTTRILKAGPLSAELRGSSLGAIRYKGVEVLRGISYLVRDENWGTCAAALGQVKISEAAERFQIKFEAKSSHGGSVLSYDAIIEASPRQLTFKVSAFPGSDFQTNRTGFVVLHPINGIAGKPVTVTHTDGTKTRSKFPKFISPGQPFFNIRALQHRPAPGLKVHVLLAGNKFEMEDQRNWSDASFKTYVCSLLDPWPYTLKAGERFEQSVTLTITGDIRSSSRATAPVEIMTGRTNARVPQIGLTVSQEDVIGALQNLARLKQLSPSFLLSNYEAGRTPLRVLKDYAAIAQTTRIPVRLELVLSATRPADEELQSVAGALRKAGLSPSAVIVTHARDLKSFQPTDPRPWGPGYEDMAAAARANFPGIPIGSGMISYFTELNRKPPPRGLFDFITHSICPIVHDASDYAVMQTLETLPHIFASAKQIIGKSPYHLGPTTIAARMNPYGKDVTANPDNRRICLAPNDPRQFGAFAITWNLGLIAAAAKTGLSAITLGPVCGARGLLDANFQPSPLFQLLADLMPLAGKRVAIQCSQSIVSLTVPSGTSRLLWAANTSAEPARIIVDGHSHDIEGYCSKQVELA